MFRPDAEDGLFTLGSIFLVYKEKDLGCILAFQDHTRESKVLKPYIISSDICDLLGVLSKHPVKWKYGNDAVSAKNLFTVTQKIEELGYDIFFWHETNKCGSVEDFYLQKIQNNI